MKIVYDHQIFGAQKYGGVSRYVFELANNLATRSAHEIGIICPIYVNEYLKRASPNLCVTGYRVPQIRKTGRMITGINQFISSLLLRRYKPDLVHETYYARSRIAPDHAKVVLTVYDMIHERFAGLFPVCDQTAINKANAVARADHVICISENTRRDLIEILGVNPAKTSVVYLGFTLTQSSEFILTKHNRPYLLYVGERKGYKNFDLLLQAYATSLDLMSNYDLIVFGGGGWRDAELKRARALGVSVERLQNVQGDDAILKSFYSNASLFIYPSLYEGFGIPLLEAMSFGCPVVSSNSGSLPEVVGNAAELFDPQSPFLLLKAIECVLNDSKYRQTLIKRGHARVQYFSWERCAEKTLKIYEQVMS